MTILTVSLKKGVGEDARFDAEGFPAHAITAV